VLSKKNYPARYVGSHYLLRLPMDVAVNGERSRADSSGLPGFPDQAMPHGPDKLSRKRAAIGMMLAVVYRVAPRPRLQSCRRSGDSGGQSGAMRLKHSAKHRGLLAGLGP